MKPTGRLARGLAAVTLACGMLAGGAVAATTASAADTSGLPDHIVNGDFEYKGKELFTLVQPSNWSQVVGADGTYLWQPDKVNETPEPWRKFTDFDNSKFAWTSTQENGIKADGTWWKPQKAGAVELQKDSTSGNVYAEICPMVAGTAIYQDIATTPGTLYKWHLRHASVSNTDKDGKRYPADIKTPPNDVMQVLIGEPGKETAQQATRVASNKAGDPTGVTMTDISTTATNDAEYVRPGVSISSRNHEGQWATYEGVYQATSNVTRFTFKSVKTAFDNAGNLLDDVGFSRAYPIVYDANGGDQSKAPKATFDKTTGRSANYASENEPTILRSDGDGQWSAAGMAPQDTAFAGWSTTKQNVAATKDEALKHVETTVNFGTNPKPTLYAVYYSTAHTVTFDPNGGGRIDPQKVSNGKTAAQPKASRDGYTLVGWYLDGRQYDFNTPVTKDITLKAAWRKTATTIVDDGRATKTVEPSTTKGRYTITIGVTGQKTATMRNTVIKDTLSDYVDPVGLVDGKDTGVTVMRNGVRLASGYTAAYSAKERSVTVTIPDALEDGVKYTVSFDVKPNGTAREYWMTHDGRYPDTGDANTGSQSSGKKGFHSNKEATVSWDAVTSTGGVPEIVPSKTVLPKPVVQQDGAVWPVMAGGLPGTGAVANLMPWITGGGLILALGAAVAWRRHRSQIG